MGTESLTASQGETLAVFETAGEPRTTSEVAEQLDLGRRSTYERLERLVDRDLLQTKKVGASARVWWRSEASPTRSGVDAPTDSQAMAASLAEEVIDDATVGAFVLDDEFDVVWIDEEIERYFGLERAAVVGRDKRELVEEAIAPNVEDSTSFADAVLSTYDDNTYAERFECRVLPGDGREERWLEHRSRPVESGPFAGGRVELYYDVTDWKRSERAHRRARSQFESLVEVVEEYAIFTLDADGHVENWNSGAGRILGYDADEVVGKHVSTFHTEADREADIPRETLEGAAAKGRVEDEGWRVRANGSRFWAVVSITAIRDDEGTLEGFVKVARDMTDRREYERHLEEQAKRLERQRDDLERELDDVLERIEDGFIALDEDLRFTYLNDYAADLLDVTESEVVGAYVWDVLERGPRAHEALERALESQELTSFEKHCQSRGTWYQNQVYPSESGLSVYFRDVTERKEREQTLEQYETLVETTSDGVYLIGPDGRLEMVNQAFADMLGYDREQLVGTPAATLLDGESVERARREHRAIESGSDATARLRVPLETAVGDELVVEATFAMVESDEGEVGVGVVRDVTDQIAHERELERQASLLDSLFEQVPVNLYLKDEEGRHLRTSTPYLRDEYDDEEFFRGKTDPEIYAGSLAKEAYEDDLRVIESGEPVIEKVEFDPVKEDWLLTSKVPWRGDDGEIRGLIGVTRVITEQKRRERDLEESKRRYQTLVDNFPNGAVSLVDEELRYLTFGGMLADDLGFENDDLPGRRVADALPDDLADVLVPRYADALAGEASTFEQSTETGVYLFQVVPVRDADGEIFAAMGMSQDITERKQAEVELERHRERLAAINSLNELVQEITAAVIDQSTRSEIEAAVCENLANSDSYKFAWIGDVDIDSQTVGLRAEAGVDGYLDDVTISVDPDDPRSNGPTGRAFRTGAVQTTADVKTDDRSAPWREHADRYEFRSSVAIPIVHENWIYGVLNVYADRPNAFDGEERTVVARLGEVVGHAIAATERKRALLSDEMVQLDFRVPDVYADLPVDDVSGTATVDRALPVADDEYVVYGRLVDGSNEAVELLVDALPHWESVTFRGTDDVVRFEVRMRESPILSALSSLGGSIERAVVQDGDYSIRIRVGAAADVRRIIDAVRAAYPGAEMLSRRQTPRSDDRSRRLQRVVSADLTDRQQATLEAAYHSGFFEWPRASSGESVAESLGVSPPTFHQHLRKAERKVFDSLLSEEASTG